MILGCNGCGCDSCSGGNNIVRLGNKKMYAKDRDELLNRAALIDKNKNNLSEKDARSIVDIVNNNKNIAEVRLELQAATRVIKTPSKILLGDCEMDAPERNAILNLAAEIDGNPNNLTGDEIAQAINLANKYKNKNNRLESEGFLKVHDQLKKMPYETTYARYMKAYNDLLKAKNNKADLLKKYPKLLAAVNNVKTLHKPGSKEEAKNMQKETDRLNDLRQRIAELKKGKTPVNSNEGKRVNKTDNSKKGNDSGEGVVR